MPGEAKTIFFVEDSDVERLAYQKVLEKAGYRVEVARDGLEGLKLLHGIIPDLVLLDLMLPKFDGVEVLKFIRSNPRLQTVPIVIFSTNSILDIQDEPLLEVATRRLLKSQCNPTVLIETIQDIFAHQDGNAPADGGKPDARNIETVKH